MDERSQDAGLPRLRGQPLQVGARLTQALAEALDVADSKPPADERIEIDAAGDDVPAGLLGRELSSRKSERVEHFGLDERQIVAAPVCARERAAALEVAVAFQAAARSGRRALDRDHCRLGLRRQHDGLDGAVPAGTSLLRGCPQRRVGRSDDVAQLDGLERLRSAERVPRNSRRCAERHRPDLTVAVARAKHRQPGPRPVEAGRISDRDEPQRALCQPVAPDGPWLRMLLVRHGDRLDIELEDRCQARGDGPRHTCARRGRLGGLHDAPIVSLPFAS